MHEQAARRYFKLSVTIRINANQRLGLGHGGIINSMQPSLESAALGWFAAGACWLG
jgi:hypothetical protein